MKNSATIDGMRARNVNPSERTIGFGDSKKRAAAKIRRAQGMTNRTAKSMPHKRRPEDFGLSEDATALKKARLKANEDFLKPVSTLEFDLSSKELRPDYSLKHKDEAEAPKKHGHKKKSKKSHKGVIALLVIVLMLAAGIGGFLVWGDKIISKMTGGNSGIFDFIGAISSNVKLKTDDNGRTNILILEKENKYLQKRKGFGGTNRRSLLGEPVA